MLIEYRQIRAIRDYPALWSSTIGRQDLNPDSSESWFKADKGIGLYTLQDGYYTCSMRLNLDENSLTKHTVWALGSPLIHPFTIRSIDDVITAMRGEWIDDKLLHPKSREVCIQQVFAYRLKCFMRKLFNPHLIKTPQVVVHNTFTSGVEDTLHFVSII